MNINGTDIDERRGCTSGSNAHADLLCPARHLAQKPFPDTRSKDAEFGDAIHKALAGDDAIMASLTQEQRDIFDRCREIEKRLMLQYLPEASKEIPMRVFREKRLWVLVDNKWEHSAKPDVVARCGPRGLIFEYKTLPGDVPDSPSNLQLRDQAVLASGTYLLNEITVAVIQPLVTMTPVVTGYNAENLKQAEAEMFERVRKSNDPTSKRVAGEVQCKHCKARLHCQEYQTFSGGSMPAMLTILDVPIAQWSPEQRAIFCDRLAIAQKWLDETKDFIKDGLEKDPEFVPGWCLKAGATRESIRDPQVVFERFSIIGGNVSQFMKAVSIQKGALREAVAGLTGAKGKSLDKAMETLTNGLTSSKQNAPSLCKKEEA